jgi:hypothetical protein
VGVVTALPTRRRLALRLVGIALALLAGAFAVRVGAGPSQGALIVLGCAAAIAIGLLIDRVDVALGLIVLGASATGLAWLLEERTGLNQLPPAIALIAAVASAEWLLLVLAGPDEGVGWRIARALAGWLAAAALAATATTVALTVAMGALLPFVVIGGGIGFAVATGRNVDASPRRAAALRGVAYGAGIVALAPITFVGLVGVVVRFNPVLQAIRP